MTTTKTLYPAGRQAYRWTTIALLAVLLGSLLATGTISAQTRYAYLPTANTRDAHFLSIAGSGFQTLGGDIMLKIGSPAEAASVEIGIFDGETSGLWDYGNVPLHYTLYADPLGDGTGTTQLAQWSGASMPDNDWFTRTISNTSQARGASGDFFYLLKVTTPDANASYLSVFKVRATGSIALIATQPFAYIAPINSLGDAQIIYPNYPVLSPTTYDGSWNFYLDVPRPQGNLEIWDGDMDYGKYDCSENDNDDQDTPNQVPSFAVGSAAVAEGTAGGGVPCVNAAGTVTVGMTTGNPPDDALRATAQRSPSVSYTVVDPANVSYANTNPSGNVEWERFRIDTAAFNRSQMDLRATRLPAGIYQVRVAGVDMSNLNAFRFPFDAIGVDTDGTPISLIRPYTVHGTVFYDANSNGVQESDEPGLDDVDLILSNGDSATTDSTGAYDFSDLDPGTYTVRVDPTSLGEGLSAASDYDGVATANVATVTVGAGQPDRNVYFGYKRENSTPGGGCDSHSWQWWACHSNDWPISYITVGCSRMSKCQAIYMLRRTRTCDLRSVVFAEIIAAKLNDADGGSSCIRSTIYDAEVWLTRAVSGNYRENCNNNSRNNCGRRECRHVRVCRHRTNNCSADRTTGTRLNTALHRYNSCLGCPAGMN